LLYLKKCIDYRHLRNDETLALFKLLLVDQAQDWLYALPEGQVASFERLEEAFMQRFTPNPLQRYQKASHMWTRNQGPTESVDAYITALKTAANQIQFRDEQQLGYCIIRGLRAPLRMHVLQNQHGTLEEIAHSARVAEIATAGSTDSDKTVAELSRTVSVLVDKLTAKDNIVARHPPPPSLQSQWAEPTTTGSHGDNRSSRATIVREVRRADSNVNNRNNVTRTEADKTRHEHVVTVWDFMPQIGVLPSPKLATIVIGAITLRGHVAHARKRTGNLTYNRDAGLPALKAGASSESCAQHRTCATIY
jgi:hypothetical protein